MSNKIDFKTKAVKRDKEGHYIMIKGSVQEEDITIINIYASNIGAPPSVRQMLTSMKGEIIRKLWYLHTMEYYSAIKKNIFEAILMKWMKLEPIIQRVISQKEKHQYSILTYIYGI